MDGCAEESEKYKWTDRPSDEQTVGEWICGLMSE